MALVVVLWGLTLLTIMAGSFSLSLRREVDLVRNAKEQVQATAIADAGIQLAMLMLTMPDQSKRWRGDGSIYEIPFQGARIRIQIYDEAGKFDINAAKEATLAKMLEKAGVGEEEALQLADTIVDWRDGDDLKHINGAELADYEDAGLAYGPRNKPFQSLQELQLVLGMTPSLYQTLEPWITIYTNTEGVDPTKASRDVLLALPDMDEATVDDYLAARRYSLVHHTPIPPFPVRVGRVVAGGATYSVRSQALLPGGGSTDVLATLGRGEGRAHLPFLQLSWKKSPVASDSLFNEGIEAVPGFVFGDGSEPEQQRPEAGFPGRFASPGIEPG